MVSVVSEKVATVKVGPAAGGSQVMWQVSYQKKRRQVKLRWVACSNRFPQQTRRESVDVVRATGAMAVSAMGSLSIFLQKIRTRCLAERTCQRAEVFLAWGHNNFTGRCCQKRRVAISVLQRGIVGRNPSSMSILQWMEEIMREGERHASLLSA